MDDATPDPPSAGALALSAVVFYLIMTLVGLGLLQYQELGIARALLGSGEAVLRDTLLGAGSGLFVVGLTWSLRRWEPLVRLNEELSAMLGAPSSPVIALLAVSSAVGEEILFRGALQPLLGLWITALIFALLHGGTAPRFRSWALFALASGLLLGAMALYTENLLAPMLCHLTINYFNLHLLSGTHAT